MRVTFDQCDSIEEICGLFNKIFANQEHMEAKIVQNAQEIEALKPKKKGKSKMKSKGSASMRVIASLMLIVAVAGLCYAAYVPTDITSEIAGNPDLLDVYLRDVLGNMASDAYLFNPRSAAPQSTEGRVYYDSDDNALLLYNGTSWQTIDAAGGMTLNSAYDFGGAGSGKTITATDGAVTIQNTEADSASLLSLSYTTGAQTGDAITITISDGTADGIEFENTGSGYDLEGTGAVWFMDKSGNLTCVDITTSDDVLLAGTNYDVAFDASRDALVFEDEAILGFGAGTHDDAPDITFIFDASGSDLNITFDDLEIAFGSDGAGGDVYFYSETASHNALFSEANDELYLTHYDVQFDDNADLILGSDDDFVIECDGADTLEILTKLTDGTATINLGVDGAGADLKMFPETAGDYVLFDSDADELYFEDCDLKLNEGSQLEFGDSGNATDWTIDTATAERLTFTPSETDDTSTFHIGTATYTSDFHLFGATANHTIWWDASAMIFYHGADADGHDIMWYGDTASSYMKWDEDGQTNGALIFEATDIVMMDGDFIKFGDGLDFTITSASAKVLTIAPAGADELYSVHIGSDQSGVDLALYGTTASDILLWDASGDYLHMIGDKVLFTLAEASAADVFKVDCTGASGDTNVIVLETTDGGIQLLADGDTEGDIDLDCEDDMTLTAAGDFTLAVTGTTILPNDVLLKTITALTHDHMDNLAATPKELVAAVAGNTIEFVSAIFAVDFGATAWTEPSAPDDLVIRYENTTGYIVSAELDAGGFATASEDTVAFLAPSTASDRGAVTEANSTNKGLFLHNTGSEWTNSGDSQVVVIVYYRLHTTAEVGL